MILSFIPSLFLLIFWISTLVNIIVKILLKKKNKAMMRGKSPRYDVEMKKKLNFVSAILDFWRAFLKQFWPNLVHTYKIHIWISFVLCVVFKCPYFLSNSRKTHFWPFIYIFQRAVTQSKIVRLTRFFSTGSEHSN